MAGQGDVIHEVREGLARIEQSLEHTLQLVRLHDMDINGRAGNGDSLGVKGRLVVVESWRDEHTKHHGRLLCILGIGVTAAATLAAGVLTPFVTWLIGKL